jgi:hypothetical protein
MILLEDLGKLGIKEDFSIYRYYEVTFGFSNEGKTEANNVLISGEANVDGKEWQKCVEAQSSIRIAPGKSTERHFGFYVPWKQPLPPMLSFRLRAEWRTINKEDKTREYRVDWRYEDNRWIVTSE